MNEKQPIQFDLNAGLSKALVDKFFEPDTVAYGVDPMSGMVQQHQRPSAIALLAGAMYTAHAHEILPQVYARIGKDLLADLIVEKVVAQVFEVYTRQPDRWNGANPEQRKLHDRVLEIVAQALGQRVIDQMDIQLGSKPALTQDPA